MTCFSGLHRHCAHFIYAVKFYLILKLINSSKSCKSLETKPTQNFPLVLAKDEQRGQQLCVVPIGKMMAANAEHVLLFKSHLTSFSPAQSPPLRRSHAIGWYRTHFLTEVYDIGPLIVNARAIRNLRWDEPPTPVTESQFEVVVVTSSCMPYN